MSRQITDREAREQFKYPIVVLDHARERLTERFGIKGARIVDEVRAAFASGRVSASRERGGKVYDGCLYLTSEDGARLYVVRVHENCFTVVTVLYADGRPG